MQQLTKDVLLIKNAKLLDPTSYSKYIIILIALKKGL